MFRFKLKDLLLKLIKYRPTYINIKNAIAFALIKIKDYYNNNYTSKYFDKGKYIYLKLNYKYIILGVTNPKI